MRTFLLPAALVATGLLLACGSSQQTKSSNGAEAMPTATVRSSSQSAQMPSADNGSAAAPAHGAPQVPSGAPPGVGQGAPDTSALDKKIEQAEAKAKASNATEADKKAAAAAYLERANIFYNAGQPMLYKFALRDFRRTLRYDPNNEEARAKRDQIEDIYTNSLHRPIPDLGNEP